MSRKKPKQVAVDVRSFSVDPEYVKKRTVIKSGNGAVISFLKEYIGKEVYIIIKDKVVAVK